MCETNQKSCEKERMHGFSREISLFCFSRYLKNKTNINHVRVVRVVSFTLTCEVTSSSVICVEELHHSETHDLRGHSNEFFFRLQLVIDSLGLQCSISHLNRIRILYSKSSSILRRN